MHVVKSIGRHVISAVVILMALIACDGKGTSIAGLNTEVSDALLDLASSRSGLVIFDADGTLWADDIGEAFLQWQIDNEILLPDQRKAIKQQWAAYLQGNVEDLDIWTQAATCQEGLEERHVRQSAIEFFDKNFEQKVFQPMRATINLLQEHGIDVWIVSASHKWIVEAGAQTLGIDGDHVIAVTTYVENGVLTGNAVHPVPHGAGKVQAINSTIGVRPDIVVGNSMGDFEMLQLANRVSIVVNPSPELERVARERKWRIQRLQ